MVLELVRWCTGYVHFTIQGTDSARFFTAAAARGFILWNMKTIDNEHSAACISAKEYHRLRSVAKKRKLRLKIEGRVGLPFFWRTFRKKKRYGFLLGGVLSLLLLTFLSTRIWVIQVTGVETLTKEQILQTASEHGLFIGANKVSLNPRSMETKLMRSYPEISWVTVNTWGNTITIAISESDPKPEVERSDETKNVVAARSGQIVSMEVYHGQAMVKVGDGVAPNQLLVSGIWEHENGMVTFTKGAAKIMARTRRTFTVTIPKEETISIPTGESVTRRSMQVFGITVPLTIRGVPKGEYEKSMARESVTVNGVELPLTIYTETYTEQTSQIVVTSKEEGERRGKEELQKQQKEALGEGEVLSEKIQITEKSDCYELVSNCLCIENIAVEQPYFLDIREKTSEEKAES